MQAQAQATKRARRESLDQPRPPSLPLGHQPCVTQAKSNPPLIPSFPPLFAPCQVRASPHKNAGTPAYLLRQHLLGTLSDRLSTRPFLTDTEKRWLVYLLLRAAAQCHGKGVCHGDIKSENVLVTSGNWLLLTDFAPFKPTLLPVRDFLTCFTGFCYIYLFTTNASFF